MNLKKKKKSRGKTHCLQLQKKKKCLLQITYSKGFPVQLSIFLLNYLTTRPFNACLRLCDFAIPEYILVLWLWLGITAKCIEFASPSHTNRFARESFSSEYKQQTQFFQLWRQNTVEEWRENPDGVNSLTVVARSLAGILGLCSASAFPSFSTASCTQQQGWRRNETPEQTNKPTSTSQRQQTDTSPGQKYTGPRQGDRSTMII